jgi:FtsP/CotA-like multicopper oxidase with cupredoxin domain
MNCRCAAEPNILIYFTYLLFYRFLASTPGTHFWHAHSGLQRSDGIFGNLVIREPAELDPHLGMYDVDTPKYSILINDWLVELSVNRFANHHHSAGDNKPASMLINGEYAYELKLALKYM